MDAWRKGLVSQLVGDAHVANATSFEPTADAQLEIAFGRARTELAYLLGLAGPNRLPFTGILHGDEIWVHLGSAAELRFRVDRAHATIVATLGGKEIPLRWDTSKKSLVEASGETVDMEAFVRAAIDQAVAAFKAQPK